MTFALGVDLGTTFTAASTWRDGVTAPVTLGEESDAVPSVLYLRDDGVLLVGEAAERRSLGDPTRVAREFKRRIGGDEPLSLGDESYTAQELTSHLLAWLLDRVSEREGARPDHVVLTCPAAWGDYRRTLLTEAAGAAGLARVGVLSEPEAAVSYYASVRRLEPGALIAVYDFGGGTFDCAVVRKTSEGLEMWGEPGGDDAVGGTDFDFCILQHVLDRIAIGADLDMSDPDARQAAAALRAAAVDAKKALSSDVVVDIPVALPGRRTTVRLTREEFESVVKDKVIRTVDTLADTLELAGVTPDDLHGVLLVGGTSRIPLVSRTIAAELGVATLADTHPKHSVSMGATIATAARLVQRSLPPASRAQPPASEPAPSAVRAMFLPVADGTSEPPSGRRIDLDEIGMTTAVDITVAPVVPRRSRTRVTATDEPVVIRLGDEPRSPAAMRVILLILVIALLVVALALLNPPG